MEEINRHDHYYLSSELIEVVKSLEKGYLDYRNRTDVVRQKLKKGILEYLDKNSLWKDKETILDITYRLPYSGMFRELDIALYDVKVIGEDEQINDNESQLTQEMTEFLRIMRRAYNRNFEKASRIQKKMRKHIVRYMDRLDLWENQEAIQEVIEILPPGYLRFNFYKTYYDLERKKNNEVQEQEDN